MMRTSVHRLLLGLIMAVFAVTAATAMRHTSTTFDEILLPAAGARGFETGNFDLVTLYHPPVLQYVYGAPVALGDFNYPVEQGAQLSDELSFYYARSFYFESGNDPERIAFIARLMGVAIGLLLILTTFLFTRAACGRGPAVLAAALVAFLPDVLAHSGISYNDVPLALVVLLALWAADAAIRDPRPSRAAVAGIALGLALGVKFSAIALGPAGLLLLALEAAARWPDRSWARRLLLRAAPIVVIALYLTLVVIYRGDFALGDFRAGLLFNMDHATAGHGAPAVLLGRYSTTGWWYFFPVAFFLKTSAGLHLLVLVALASFWLAPARKQWRQRVASPLRPAAVGAVVFTGFVMAANLNIGFRHVLPVLPLVCILVACAVARVWSLRRRALNLVISAAVLWHIVAPLLAYPFFISYLSEYAGPEEYSYETLVDSSLDWGQGLLALRDYMAEEGVETVYLSYFGSAVPEAYGIRYVALPSFFTLQPSHDVDTGVTPALAAISATNLAGNYLAGDPFARFRDVRPVAVLAGSIFIFELGQ